MYNDNIPEVVSGAPEPFVVVVGEVCADRSHAICLFCGLLKHYSRGVPLSNYIFCFEKGLWSFFVGGIRLSKVETLLCC